MADSEVDLTRLPSAALTGRVASVTGRATRDLTDCASRYSELFPPKPFDPALFHLVCMANAACAPWLEASDLQVANRTSLWAFAVDWFIDYLATSADEVRDIIARCLAVADGGAPRQDDPLTQFLAEIYRDLARRPAFPLLVEPWREQFRLMLVAMGREWDWRAARRTHGAPLPTVAEYLDNADNICFSWVVASHYLACSQPPLARVDEVIAAGRSVQTVIRILNDLGTYDRDREWGDGDLNIMMLGPSRDEVRRICDDSSRQAREMLVPIRDAEPQLAEFLNRYIDFNRTFYDEEQYDYWGALA